VDLFIYPFLFSFECFLLLGAATYKKSLSLEFLEAKSQREKKKYLRGALDSAQFFIA